MKKLISLTFAAVVALVCVTGLTAQVVRPRTIDIPDPEYPPEALKAHRGGWVYVTVLVSKKGKVSVREAYGPLTPCSKQLGDPITTSIRRSAIAAAKKASFEPGTKDGRPAEVALELKYVFDPDKKPGEKPREERPPMVRHVEWTGNQIVSAKSPRGNQGWVGKSKY